MEYMFVLPLKGSNYAGPDYGFRPGCNFILI
jgi:hypothetical protein